MPALVDITSERFGRLVVVDRAGSQSGHSTWLCRCDCGRRKPILGESLRRGLTQSCGCLQREWAAKGTHGHTRNRTGTKTYRAWQSAKDRCFNPRCEDYPNYGGRGIRMCDRWRNDYAAFLADMGESPPGLTLDRIDNDGDYEPGNCRWATLLEQARNKRAPRSRQ
jgi:hypothetical protein